MSEYVNLKIQIDVLRTALDKAILQEHSLLIVRKIHASIKKTERLMQMWEKTQGILKN